MSIGSRLHIGASIINSNWNTGILGVQCKAFDPRSASASTPTVHNCLPMTPCVQRNLRFCCNLIRFANTATWIGLYDNPEKLVFMCSDISTPVSFKAPLLMEEKRFPVRWYGEWLDAFRCRFQETIWSSSFATISYKSISPDFLWSK